MAKKPETAEDVMTQGLRKIMFAVLVVLVAIIAVAVL